LLSAENSDVYNTSEGTSVPLLKRKHNVSNIKLSLISQNMFIDKGYGELSVFDNENKTKL
jgi:hypothetical protein